MAPRKQGWEQVFRSPSSGRGALAPRFFSDAQSWSIQLTAGRNDDTRQHANADAAPGSKCRGRLGVAPPLLSRPSDAPKLVPLRHVAFKHGS